VNFSQCFAASFVEKIERRAQPFVGIDNRDMGLGSELRADRIRLVIDDPRKPKHKDRCAKEQRAKKRERCAVERFPDTHFILAPTARPKRNAASAKQINCPTVQII
jgi:hypothetical protein